MPSLFSIFFFFDFFRLLKVFDFEIFRLFSFSVFDSLYDVILIFVRIVIQKLFLYGREIGNFDLPQFWRCFIKKGGRLKLTRFDVRGERAIESCGN